MNNGLEILGRFSVLGLILILINLSEWYKNYQPNDLTDPLAWIVVLLTFGIGLWVIIPICFKNKIENVQREEAC